MQTLGVVVRLFPAILSGEKRSTIRFREIRMVPGFMRYVVDGDPTRTAVVFVTRCTDMPLSRAAAFVGREDDWPRDVMMAGMREHYPDIGWDDPVQVVEHLSPQESSRIAGYPVG